MQTSDPPQPPTKKWDIPPDLIKDGTMLMCGIHGIPFPKGSHCPKCPPFREGK